MWFEAELRLKNNESVNKELLAQIRTEAERSHAVLQRIVEITLYLAEHNIAFRGSSAKPFTKNNGNFLGLVQLLGKFDNVMMEHLRRISENESHVHMLSVSMQNEIISLLAKKVKQSIIDKVKNAKYFSVIMDCTPDLSHKEQVSLVVRYVYENDATNEVSVEESFIGYTITNDTTGKALTDLLMKELVGECGLDMDNCRGQGFDNGANMVGANKGVKAHILQEFPRAVFTSCACHSLNLIISDGAKSSVKSTSLFGILQRIYTIFASSTKRWCIVSEKIQSLTLKEVCETRWEARINSVQAVRYQYCEVRDALIELSESVNDATTASEAQSLVNHMEDFSFLVCLIAWHEILFHVNLVSKTLQGSFSDIPMAVTQFQKCDDFLKTFREKGFTDAIITAKEIAEEIDIEPVFKEKRHSKKKRLFSYEASDVPQASPKELFEREVFIPLVDNVMMSLKERSNSLMTHKKHWGFLFDLKNLPPVGELKDNCKELQNVLSDKGVSDSDINGNDLFNELLHVGSILEHGNEQLITPIQVLKVLKDQKDLFTNLWISLRILLTIPVTVASAERSFSKLKLIKTYLRSTMTQERLNGLAILSIENEEAKKVEFKDVLYTFANAKARKMPFAI